MREPSPYKRQRGPHDSAEESDPTKRACHGQPNLLDASRLHELMWLTPTLSSVPSQGNSVSPFAFSDSGSPFLPPLDPHKLGGQEQEGVVFGSSDENDRCCFGEILIDFMSSATLDQDNSHVPVELQFSNNTIKLHVEGSGEYVGLLDSKAIADLVQTYEVTLTTTLSCPVGSKKKPSDTIQTPKTLHIVVYGLRKDMDNVGDFLEDCDLFLQHPTEYDNRLEYLNPQYLLRPGSSMPRAEDAAFHALPSQQSSSDRTLEEKPKSQVHQVFDSANGPSSFFQVQQSPRLKTSLKEHQQKALAMMAEKDCGLIDNTTFPSLWAKFTDSNGDIKYRHVVTGRAENSPALVCGGVLADDMGLGKTLSTIALIAWFLDLIDNGFLFESCRTTLIIAPNSTIPGWQEQVNRHTFPDQVRIALYHGPLRDQIATSLSDYDIVLTTYGTLKTEWKSKNEASPLFSMTWARVVLDEAHHIRDRSTQKFKAVTAVRTTRKWCLTGTPIQNRLDDYGSLLSFIGVPHLISKSTFDFWVGTPVGKGHSEGLTRLRRLVSATCLRRTKNSVRGDLNLPCRKIRDYTVQLDQDDREVYDFFKRNASHLLAGMPAVDSDKEPRTGNILPIINTLRLICNHGQSLLPVFALKAWSQRYDPRVNSDSTAPRPGLCFSCGADASSYHTESEFACSHLLCSSCADSDEGYQPSLDSVVCPLCAKDELSITNGNVAGIEGNYQPSAKIRALIQNLCSEQQNTDCTPSGGPVKSVVFTFWIKMLNLLEIALLQAGFQFERIDGQKSLVERTSALRSFNTDNNCNVMIATIGSIGEGVDLTVASCVHLLEPHWNPMIEEQALDRVHRMGQTRDVIATRYITENSIETFVRGANEGKLQLINMSLGQVD